jgi:glycosyltransferase involved in cell wall biosynthesis
MARPLLRALVDTYNHEKFIEQAIVSFLEQDFPMKDVDDGSTDHTPGILRRDGGSRWELYQAEKTASEILRKDRHWDTG